MHSHRGQMALKNHSGGLLGDPDRARSQSQYASRSTTVDRARGSAAVLLSSGMVCTQLTSAGCAQRAMCDSRYNSQREVHVICGRTKHSDHHPCRCKCGWHSLNEYGPNMGCWARCADEKHHLYAGEHDQLAIAVASPTEPQEDPAWQEILLKPRHSSSALPGAPPLPSPPR